MRFALTQEVAVAGHGIPYVVEEPVGAVHQDCILFLAPERTDVVGWVAVRIQAVLRRAVVVHPWAHFLFPWKLQRFLLVLRCSFHACWIQEIQVAAVAGWTMGVVVLHAFVAVRGWIPSFGSTSRSTRQYKHSIDPLSKSSRPFVAPSLAFVRVSSFASRLFHVCLLLARCDASNLTKDRCFRLLPAFFFSGRTSTKPQVPTASGRLPSLPFLFERVLFHPRICVRDHGPTCVGGRRRLRRWWRHAAARPSFCLVFGFVTNRGAPWVGSRANGNPSAKWKPGDGNQTKPRTHNPRIANTNTIATQ